MTVSNPLVTTGLIAHRGASKFYPENTMAALDGAAERGAKWVETDVQFTLDGDLVMIHDRELDRTTNGTGFVALQNSEHIQALDAGSWMDRQFSSERVPTLSDYLERIMHHGLNLQLELKERTGREEYLVDLVCEHLQESWDFEGQSQIFLSSFSERCIKHAAKRLPDVPLALARGYLPENPLQIATENSCSILHVQDRFLRSEDLDIIQNCPLEFGVATVNDAARAKYLLANGVQHVLSDDPDLLT